MILIKTQKNHWVFTGSFEIILRYILNKNNLALESATVNVWNPNIRNPNYVKIQTFAYLDFRQYFTSEIRKKHSDFDS